MKKQSNRAFIKEHLLEGEKIINKVSVSDLDKIITLLFEAWQKEATVFVMGNGGSASTASHFAADLTKYPVGSTYEKEMKRFKAICLNDNVPAVSAWTNDVGFETIFSEQLKPWLKKNDLLVAFSVHGGSGSPMKGKKWSQNIPMALELAKQRGAKIIGFSGDTGGVLKKMADACVVVPTINEDTITPQVEGFHVVLDHLVIHRLKQLIQSA